MNKSTLGTILGVGLLSLMKRQSGSLSLMKRQSGSSLRLIHKEFYSFPIRFGMRQYRDGNTDNIHVFRLQIRSQLEAFYTNLYNEEGLEFSFIKIDDIYNLNDDNDWTVLDFKAFIDYPSAYIDDSNYTDYPHRLISPDEDFQTFLKIVNEKVDSFVEKLRNEDGFEDVYISDLCDYDCDGAYECENFNGTMKEFVDFMKENHFEKCVLRDWTVLLDMSLVSRKKMITNADTGKIYNRSELISRLRKR